VSGRARRTGVGGFVLLTLATVLPALLIAGHDPRVPTGTRLWAALLWVLCLLPSWARHLALTPRRPIPFFPVVGLLFASFFALPISAPVGMLVQQTVHINPAVDYDLPVRLAVAGWASLLAGYAFLALVGGPARRPPTTVRWDVPALTRMALALLGASLAVQFVRLTMNVPTVVNSIAVLVVSFGWFGAGVLVILAVRRQLPWPARAAMAAGILASAVLQLAGGQVSDVLVWVAVVSFAVLLARGYLGRRWIVVMALLGSTLMIYRSIKGEWSNLAWYSGTQVSPLKKVQFAYELGALSVRERGFGMAVLAGIERTGRWSTVDMFADVVRKTPQRVPFWNGSTYRSLAGVLVPRVVWPGKPTKTLGNEFGQRYGYLTSDDRGTSINLPFFVEFYLNFAATGVVAGMFLVGMLYQALERRINRPGQDAVLSILAVNVFVPLFNVESDFSLLFGGIFMTGFAQWVLFRMVRALAEDRPPAPVRPGVEAAPGAAGSGWALPAPPSA